MMKKVIRPFDFVIIYMLCYVMYEQLMINKQHINLNK